MIRKKDIFSIPNIISYIRLLLLPIFVYVYIHEPTLHLKSAIILFTATLTDGLDGYVARHFNMITDLGRLIDPIADKLYQLVLSIILTIKYPAFISIVMIVIIENATLLFLGIYMQHKKGQHITQAKLPGKLATSLFFLITMIFVLLEPVESIYTYIMILIVFLGFVIAFIYYLYELYKIYRGIE